VEECPVYKMNRLTPQYKRDVMKRIRVKLIAHTSEYNRIHVIKRDLEWQELQNHIR